MKNDRTKYRFVLFISLAIFYAGCFSIKPEMPGAAPEIRIFHNSERIEAGSTIVLNTFSGNSKNSDFIIGNTGLSDLEIKDININNTDGFSLIQNPVNRILPGKLSGFTIELSSPDSITQTELTITSNDPAEKFAFFIESQKSGIQVFFAGPDYDLSLMNAIIHRINEHPASECLDICAYGLDSEPVLNAVVQAVQRGVHARFVGNLDGNTALSGKTGDYYDAYYILAAALDEKFPVAGKLRTDFPAQNGFDDFILRNDAIMHNKFMIFKDESNNDYVLTGSTNFTETGFLFNNNNSLLIRDEEVAGTYRRQFEFLLGLPGKEPVQIAHHSVSGIPVEIIFAPMLFENKTSMDYIIEIASSAKESIRFMIFSFTYLELFDIFVQKQNDGISVQGIFDESQLYNSSEEILVNSGIPCRSDGNFNTVDYFHGGKLHHKTMIVDECIVATGSSNWSNNANFNNDENIIIINSPEIAGLYLDEWQSRWDEGIGLDPVTEIDDGEEEEEEEEIAYDYGEYQDIIINEVMWMGSRRTMDESAWNDEFIELKNMTGREINLLGWSMEGAASAGKALFLEEMIIPASGLLVIMHRTPEESAFNPGIYFTESGLSIGNSELDIKLMDPSGNEIDRAGNGSAAEDFAGYNETLKKSMARNEIPGNGDDPGNWFTSNTQMNISAEPDYSLYNLATPGAENDLGEIFHEELSVVFSEVAWAGTDESTYDEWLELYNNTDQDISLLGWSITGGLEIELYGIIPARKYLLFERTNDDSVPGKTADIIYTGGLNNGGEILILMCGTREIDGIYMEDGWAAGSNSPKISMERTDPLLPGDDSNWHDGPGDTEGARNSGD